MIKQFNKKKGMTLVEVIIAVAVFAIMAIMFISLFSSSVLWIFGAGDRGEAYSKAQADIEERLGTKDASESPDLVIRFNGSDHAVEGGLVESDQTVGDKNSKLVTFLPLVPTISIDYPPNYPSTRFEGYTKNMIYVTGTNTNFATGSTTVQLYDKSGSILLSTINNPTVTTSTTLSFTIPSGIFVLNNDYIVRVRTPIATKPDQLTRAKFVVGQPKFIAIGESAVYVSAVDSNNPAWMNRSSMTGFPLTSNQIHATANNGLIYLVVGDGGLVYYSEEQKPWKKTVVSTEDLLGVHWSLQQQKFYAVGAEGSIYSSTTGSSWSAVFNTVAAEEGVDYGLRDVLSTNLAGNTMLNAVGAGGRLLYSTNGSTWNTVATAFTEDLNGITSGLNPSSQMTIVTVGNNGRIATSTNGIDWSSGVISGFEDRDLNDVHYYNGLFIIVGENGLILTSVDGTNWANHSIGINTLRSIFARGSDYLAVGDNGTVLYSTNGTSWSTTTGIPGVDLKSVVGR